VNYEETKKPSYETQCDAFILYEVGRIGYSLPDCRMQNARSLRRRSRSFGGC